VWDFDLSYFNFYTSRTNSLGQTGYTYRFDNLFAAYFPISGYDTDLTDDSGSGRPTLGVSWVGQLMQNETFVKRVAQVYFADFLPYLETLTDQTQEGGALVTQMGEAIQGSAEMNNARWHMYGGKEYRVFGPKNGDNFTECVDYIRNFLEQRSAWLTQLWSPYLEETVLLGDLNEDGFVTVSDAVLLEQWLLGESVSFSWEAADLTGDRKLDGMDLVLLRQVLLEEV
jgi:hypothetical protein